MDRDEATELFRQAFPVEGQAYVTHRELTMALENVEARASERLVATELQLGLRIKASELTQRNWILSGVVATLLATGGGYVSLVMKLDRLEQNLPLVQQAIGKQTEWMERQELKDQTQDEGLREINPKYTPYITGRE